MDQKLRLDQVINQTGHLSESELLYSARTIAKKKFAELLDDVCRKLERTCKEFSNTRLGESGGRTSAASGQWRAGKYLPKK